MKPLLSAYVGLVILLGSVVLVHDLRLFFQNTPEPAGLVDRGLWILLLLLISRFPISGSDGHTVSTLNSAINYCMILGFGAAFAGPAVAINSLYLNIVRRRAPWFKVLFNLSQIVLAVNLASWLYQLGGGRTGMLPDFTQPIVLLQLLLPFFGFTIPNLLLVAIVVRLQTGTPILKQMTSNHYFDLWGTFILFYIGAQLSYLYIEFRWMGVALAIVPLIWVYLYLTRYYSLNNANIKLHTQRGDLERKSGELMLSNQRLESLNSKLADNQETLAAKTRELEQVNQSLKDLNEDLKHTRRSLVQSEKLKAMGQMAGGVAHDFNNILGAISARTELLQLEPVSDKLRRGLDLIHRSALDGASVVRRIQDFSRVTQETEFSHLDCHKLMQEVVEMTRPIWKDKANHLGLTYRVELERGEGVWVHGNAPELREVLHNLIKNALEAMPEGGDLMLSCQRMENRAVLEVRDSGHGMTDDVIEHLFDPYFTTKGNRGNGLGLSVSYGIIQRHGGEIRAASLPGEGSSMRILLPLASPPRTNELPVATKRMSLGGLKPRRVLVVDDEKDVREVLCDTLSMMGHEVSSAVNGQKALDLWLREKQDLIFTDLGMPGMNGWELADRIRQSASDAGEPQPQMILVTGWSAQVRTSDQEQHRIDRILSKPFKLSHLKQMLLELEAGTGQ